MSDRSAALAAMAAQDAPPGEAGPDGRVLPPLVAPRHPDELAADYTGSDPAEVARVTAALRGAEAAETARQVAGGLHGLPGGPPAAPGGSAVVQGGG